MCKSVGAAAGCDLLGAADKDSQATICSIIEQLVDYRIV
jgi:hypothetical protein